MTHQDSMIEAAAKIIEDADRELSEHDSVDTRWARGSAIRVLLQHLAVREGARTAVAERLRQRGLSDLARNLVRDAECCRRAIDDLEESVRGFQAIDANSPEITAAAKHAIQVWAEDARQQADVLAQIARQLGASGQRDLPSAHTIQMMSTLHPRVQPRWYDHLKPIKMLRAWYQYWRASSSDDLSPAVDGLREQTPGRGL